MEQPRQLSTEVSMLPNLKETKIEIPDIQREGNRWTLPQKRKLIDSCYNRFPIPPLYFREEQRESPTWWQVDGQQRVEAILDFLANKFTLAKDGDSLPEDMYGKYFRQLTNEQRNRILSRTIDYTVVVCSDEEEEEMFQRLNNGSPLGAAEIRNAIRGEFNDAAKKLAKHPFITDCCKIAKNQFARDAFCAQLMLMATIDGPADIRDSNLTVAYRKLKTFEERPTIVPVIVEFLDRLHAIFPIKYDILVKHSLLTYFMLFRKMDEQGLTTQISDQDLFKFLSHFEIERKKVLASPDQFEANISRMYFEYDHLARYGTDRGTSLKKKGEILLDRLIEIHDLKPVEAEEA